MSRPLKICTLIVIGPLACPFREIARVINLAFRNFAAPSTGVGFMRSKRMAHRFSDGVAPQCTFRSTKIPSPRVTRRVRFTVHTTKLPRGCRLRVQFPCDRVVAIRFCRETVYSTGKTTLTYIRQRCHLFGLVAYNSGHISQISCSKSIGA